ncbi:carboxylating nicotinate-nucleotide diphosphorylase [Planctomicrobium sp. SH668]|uniref:carboxylating nicotinate-nucleotide diphosphorylase n=1 Tax=Planctomicrobium sp. SH668 TaxID=3448126 RepID=UPI003F5C6E8D
MTDTTLQIPFSDSDRQAATNSVRLALQEDLGSQGDVTSTLFIPATARGELAIVARKPGVLCGNVVVPLILNELGNTISVMDLLADGSRLDSGTVIARLNGPVQALLTAERTILNFLTLLSGVATETSKYVTAISGTKARILDTRKTLPGLRALQKYAVRCGGGVNHRIGLYDAVLVKDNHLASFRELQQASLDSAVLHLKANVPPGMIVQFEVDTLDQLEELLPSTPDIILLDNMSLEELRQAVQRRNGIAPQVLLEASGGVSLATVADIAATGVDRISVGAITHSAPALDIGFDWIERV